MTQKEEVVQMHRSELQVNVLSAIYLTSLKE